MAISSVTQLPLAFSKPFHMMPGTLLIAAKITHWKGALVRSSFIFSYLWGCCPVVPEGNLVPGILFWASGFASLQWAKWCQAPW